MIASKLLAIRAQKSLRFGQLVTKMTCFSCIVFTLLTLYPFPWFLIPIRVGAVVLFARTCVISAFGAFESHHDDRFRMGPTTHRFPKLLLIREGVGKIQFESHELSCKAGDLLVVAAGERHWLVDQPGRPMSLLGLGLSPKLLASVPSVTGELCSGVFAPEQTVAIQIEQRMRRLLYLERQSDPARQLACVGGAIELFAEWMMTLSSKRSPSRPAGSSGSVQPMVQPARDLSQEESSSRNASVAVHPLIQSYLAWLRDHFYEDLDIQQASSACKMSRRHFTACFRQATGTSWLDYVHHLRIRYAIELLQQTDRKITSIAFGSGFRDLTTFYRVMAKLTGKRPAEFRRSINKVNGNLALCFSFTEPLFQFV